MAKRHSAPKYLTPAAQKQWNDTYSKALVQAKVNFPSDENAQFAAAHKEANKMLAIAAPTSAAEIDKLDDWQVVPGSVQTKLVDGIETKVCVTIDGRKHAHPLKKQPAEATETEPKK